MKFLRRFNSSDRDAAIVLALVIIVSIVLFPHLSEQDMGVPSSRFQIQRVQGDNNCQSSTVNCQLFKFDPNTATESQLLSFGLSQREVRNILKYRARGGRYRVKEDFARVYGLTLEKYRQLEPYITINPQIMAADVIKREKNTPHTSSITPHASSIGPQPSSFGPRASRKLRYGETVDINSADTAMLKRIPGIGDYYAMRIVELRKRKQVFSSPEELLAIRNFPETALTYMTTSTPSGPGNPSGPSTPLRTEGPSTPSGPSTSSTSSGSSRASFPLIYINVQSRKELASHPLLNYLQARDIISLRRLSGRITSAKDLAALPSFTPALIEKITPLLRF